jgi:hypothetical protein
MRHFKSFSRLHIKLDDIDTINKLSQKSTKPNWHGYVSFFTGSILTVSETMPFIDSNYNGILHALSKIQEEYKSDFK